MNFFTSHVPRIARIRMAARGMARGSGGSVEKLGLNRTLRRMPINFINLSSGGASVADWAPSPKRHPPRGPRGIIQKFKLRILLGASGTRAARREGRDERKRGSVSSHGRRKTQQKEGSGRCAAAREPPLGPRNGRRGEESGEESGEEMRKSVINWR